MINNLKLITTLLFALSYLLAEKELITEEDAKLMFKINDHRYFTYPSSLIDYSISGISEIEFRLSKKGEIEKINILKSLGHPFDRSIIDGFDDFINTEFANQTEKLGKYYILRIKFES